MKYTPLDPSLADLAELRVKWSRDRSTLALVGLDPPTARRILILARLYLYDNPYKPPVIDPKDSVAVANAMDSWTYDRAMVDVIEHLEWLLDRSCRPEYAHPESVVALHRETRLRLREPAFLVKPDPKPNLLQRLWKWIRRK